MEGHGRERHGMGAKGRDDKEGCVEPRQAMVR